MTRLRIRRAISLLLLGAAVAIWLSSIEVPSPVVPADQQPVKIRDARALLGQIEVKGRAPKTGYSRKQFGDGWASTLGCDTRNRILSRDLTEITYTDGCKVNTGKLHDPYTGQTLQFIRGPETSDDIQIDHVVALSDSWQKGAQALSALDRIALANDPLNLLAVDGNANQDKSDSDAASWLPPNKSFRCSYVSRQVQVKIKYQLWVTEAEKTAIEDVLSRCR